MAKRSRKNSIDKKLKDGRGIGAGLDYKPWLVIQDVSSLGRSTRLKGIKIPRQYDFLSEITLAFFNRIISVAAIRTKKETNISTLTFTL